MDDVYRYQRYIYDFTRKYYLFGRDDLIAGLALKPGASVIEVGCGTGRNLIKIARLYPETRLFGLDASSEMLATARGQVEKAGLSGKIALIQAYAEDLSPALFDERDGFDAVVFSYSLSMIPDWKQALMSAQRSLRPDGTVHVVDFGDLKGVGPGGEALLRAWLGLFHVAPRGELLAALERLQSGSAGGLLRLLPGRYAFVWNAGAKAISGIS